MSCTPTAISGSTRTEYVYDGRGSVAAEVSYNNAWYTFGGGIAKKQVISKTYTPFGELIGEATSGFGYNGEYYNAATGMIYLRARFYEPELNRFSQKDILRGSVIQPGSLNRYLYCQNDPVNYSDPSGMRQVAGIYGDGTGRTSTAKQTTPIVTKPSQSKVSSSAASTAVTSRTVAVPMTDTGTGGNRSAASAAAGINPANAVNDNSAYAQAQRDREALENRRVTNLSITAGNFSSSQGAGTSTISTSSPTVTTDNNYSCSSSKTERTPVRVIVYDKTEYNSTLNIWEYQGFRDQAINSPYFDYQDTENVTMIYVETAQEFIEAWNASNNTERLYIYAHSGRGTRSGNGAMIFENQAISFNDDDLPDPNSRVDYSTYMNYSYDHLDAIAVERIYLVACHGAAYDLDHNIAVELAERSGAVVTANTGSVSFTEVFGEYYARSGMSLSEGPILGIWKQVSVDESGNAHWSLQNPHSFIGGEIK